jgi:hypothetical protein
MLAYDFTEIASLREKLTETPYFLAVTAIYECLWILKKNKFSPVWRKSDQSPVFLGRGPHIPYQLYITVPYTSFYGLWKIEIFSQNT